MKHEPLNFSINVADFDLAKLPINAELLRSDRQLLESAIYKYFVEYLSPLGGDTQIELANGVVSVRWIPEAGLSGLLEYAISLLKRGDYQTAVPMLKSAHKLAPDDPTILFNLGMALSDMNLLRDSIELLSRLTKLGPTALERGMLWE